MPKSVPLTQQQINHALVNLPGWQVLERTPQRSDHVHVELHRLFPFSSFTDAMHFMATAARFVQLQDHHPSWLNTYSKVEVWITTGDLKHKLSANDVRLAGYLDELYRQYQVQSP